MNAGRVGPTQGPWRAIEIDPKDPTWGACEIWPVAGGRPVATMVCGVSNAQLMAAAPKLLAALKSIVASLAEHDDEGMIEHAEQMIAARTAIAEATGEQP